VVRVTNSPDDVDNVERIGRFEWERAVLRIAMPTTTKLVGLALATYGNRDGSNAHPGEARLARELGLSQRAVRKHLALLRDDLRLIVKISHGGSRSGHADTYRLGLPNDLDPALLIDDPALQPRNPGAGVSTEHRNDGAGVTGNEDSLSAHFRTESDRNEAELRNVETEHRNVGALTPEPERHNSGTVVPPTIPTTLSTNQYSSLDDSVVAPDFCRICSSELDASDRQLCRRCRRGALARERVAS